MGSGTIANGAGGIPSSKSMAGERMDEHLLSISLVSDEGGITFAALEQAVADLRRLVRNVDRAVLHQYTTVRTRKWYVERLHSNAPTIVLRAEALPTTPTRDFRDTPAVLVAGLQRLEGESQQGPPELFSERELENLLRFRSLFRKGVDRVEVSAGAIATTGIISRHTEAAVERILLGASEAWGSLEGELEAIDVHRAPRFTMWERLSGQAVRCYFGSEQVDVVKDLLGRRVRVSGLISYFSNGTPRAMRQLAHIEGVSPTQPLELWGSVSDLTNGMDSVDYLRAAWLRR
jgi:hypothetical protein